MNLEDRNHLLTVGFWLQHSSQMPERARRNGSTGRAEAIDCFATASNEEIGLKGWWINAVYRSDGLRRGEGGKEESDLGSSMLLRPPLVPIYKTVRNDRAWYNSMTTFKSVPQSTIMSSRNGSFVPGLQLLGRMRESAKTVEHNKRCWGK
eukprot:2603680-Rhodomonas_salina.3